jgi:hypothetical protein
MIRSLALSASFVVIAAVPTLAQVHHGTGHMPPDSAHHTLLMHSVHAEHHARVHALLVGLWEGTFASTDGQSGPSRLSIALDSTFQVTLVVGTDLLAVVPSAHSLMISSDTLRWTQQVAGKSCRTVANFSAATTLAPETMVGKMVCEDREITFTLFKKAG